MPLLGALEDAREGGAPLLEGARLGARASRFDAGTFEVEMAL